MRKIFGILAAALTALPASFATAQQVGIVASLNPNIEGTPPGSDARSLAVGINVVANERVVSSPNGRGQLLFRDHTTLSIAPNSELVLDKFVYDPERQTGEIALSLTKGALRFVGGQITKGSEGVITTPTTTIGIRGGLVLVRLTDTGVRAILLAGEYLCVKANTNRHCASRPGAVVTEDGYQGQADEAELNDFLRAIDGADGPYDDSGFFAQRPTGGTDVGAPNRPGLSTSGEERDIVIFEERPDRDVFTRRRIGGDAMHDMSTPPTGGTGGTCC